MDKLMELTAAYIDAHRQEMLDLWEELVMIESGSEQKAGVDRVCARLQQEMEKEGIKTRVAEMEKAGNSLIGLWGEERSKKPLLFLGHMDTVFNQDGVTKERPFTIRDGMAYGPGVLDMKSGLIIGLYAVKALKAAGYNDRPIKFLYTGDEEPGHVNSTGTQLHLDECEGAMAALNFETGYPHDGIVIERKGSAVFSVEVEGVAAHAGNSPEKGRSAILEMSHKIIELQALNDFEKGTTVNVGLIEGGTVVNAVPNCCKIRVDVRYVTMEALEELRPKVEAIVAKTFVEGTSSKITWERAATPMPCCEGNLKLFEILKKTAQEIGYPGELVPHKVGGWSDSCIVASKGVPVVDALGTKGSWNHAPNEYAEVESLFTRAKLAAAFVINLKDDIQ